MHPAAELLASATVIGPSLTWADVLATAAYVEGPRALTRIEAMTGYEAILALPDGRLVGSAGAAALLAAAA